MNSAAISPHCRVVEKVSNSEAVEPEPCLASQDPRQPLDAGARHGLLVERTVVDRAVDEHPLAEGEELGGDEDGVALAADPTALLEGDYEADDLAPPALVDLSQAAGDLRVAAVLEGEVDHHRDPRGHTLEPLVEEVEDPSQDLLELDMARAGIEPATPRFSVVCSTD
jgi:hypothetical protein